jgi:glutamate dehydrogenase (NADP+)
LDALQLALAANNLGTTALSRDQLDAIVKDYMRNLHDRVAATAADFNAPGDLHVGVNIAGFLAVAQAMFRQGAV